MLGSSCTWCHQYCGPCCEICEVRSYGESPGQLGNDAHPVHQITKGHLTLKLWGWKVFCAMAHPLPCALRWVGFLCMSGMHNQPQYTTRLASHPVNCTGSSCAACSNMSAAMDLLAIITQLGSGRGAKKAACPGKLPILGKASRSSLPRALQLYKPRILI